MAAGTEGGTGLGRRSELIRLGNGFGGLSGASTESVNNAATPASESRERRPKAAAEDEQEEEDDEDEEPPISDRVRRVGGSGTRGLGKSYPFSSSAFSSEDSSLGPLVNANGGNSE